MRILYFSNNRLGWRIGEWLRDAGEDIVGLVLHPPERAKFSDRLIEATGVPPDRIFDATKLSDDSVVASLRSLGADIGLSVLFGYIVKPPVLQIPSGGCINLHPALLPYNRGAYPNVWSILDQTPAGVTLHYMDEGVDTGDVIAQVEVVVEPVDTGASLYQKLEEAAYALFRETWPAIREGRVSRTPQVREGGTLHKTRDVESIDEIDLDRTYPAGHLIDVLRARTFPGFPGAYFLVDGRKVYLRLELAYGDE